DLGAIDRGRHDVQTPLQHTEIEAGEMKDLENRPVGEKLGQIRRCARACRDLHHVGGAVARRQLHHAQPIADRIKPHRFGVDRHGVAAVAREVGQIAAMQADSHDGPRTGDAANLVPRRGLEPPRLAALVPETSASTNSATWAAWRLGTEQACGCQIGGTHALYRVKPILYSAIEALERACPPFRSKRSSPSSAARVSSAATSCARWPNSATAFASPSAAPSLPAFCSRSAGSARSMPCKP